MILSLGGNNYENWTWAKFLSNFEHENTFGNGLVEDQEIILCLAGAQSDGPTLWYS